MIFHNMNNFNYIHVEIKNYMINLENQYFMEKILLIIVSIQYIRIFHYA